MAKNNRNSKAFLDYAHKYFSCCQWCLQPLLRDKATADHIRPSSKGGSDKWNNLLVSCYECNHGKRNKLIVDRDGTLIDNDMRPHGPRWHGPYKDRRRLTITSFWCDCHTLQQGYGMSRSKKSKTIDSIEAKMVAVNPTSYAIPSLQTIRTWGQIKQMIKDAGVNDDDLIFSIDLGADLEQVYINRDNISCTKALVEIGDHPSIVANDMPDDDGPGDIYDKEE